MSIQLLVPGLLWPAATAFSPAAGLALPGLERLLGLGRRRIDAFRPFERQLAELFGCAHLLADADADTPALPLAALRRGGEDAPLPAGEAHWLCADPVTLAFARDHMLLSEVAPASLSQADADALLEALNETFAELGRFEACAPTRWYLRLAAAPQVRLYPLQDVVGRPVKHFLPEGRDARQWQRILNEAQIVLHNHALNRRREAAGEALVNSLWLWGAGSFAHPPRAPAAAIQSRDPLIRGLARACALPVQAPTLAGALQAHTLVVLDDLQQPALQRDLEAWRTRLQALESAWFAPLAAALGSGRLDRLRLSAPSDRGTLEVELRAAERWKFWRKPYPLAALLDTLAAGSAPGAAQAQ